MIQARDKSSATRPTSAMASPSVRARACSLAGSFDDRIEMKTMLSTPSTISRAVKVKSAIQACGSVNPIQGAPLNFERASAKLTTGQTKSENRGTLPLRPPELRLWHGHHQALAGESSESRCALREGPKADTRSWPRLSSTGTRNNVNSVLNTKPPTITAPSP